MTTLLNIITHANQLNVLPDEPTQELISYIKENDIEHTVVHCTDDVAQLLQTHKANLMVRHSMTEDQFNMYISLVTTWLNNQA